MPSETSGAPASLPCPGLLARGCFFAASWLVVGRSLPYLCPHLPPAENSSDGDEMINVLRAAYEETNPLPLLGSWMEVKVEREVFSLFSVGWWRAEDPVSDPKPFPRVTNRLVFRLNCLTASGSLEGPSQSLSPRGRGGTPHTVC